MSRRPRFEIAAAVIRRRDGRVLIARRPPGAALAGLWEFPGGKREPGESIAAACRREIREELGIGVAVGRRIALVRHAYPHAKVVIHFLACRLALSARQRVKGPRAIGCSAWRWVRPEELGRYRFPEANRGVVSLLLNQSNRRRAD